MNEIACCVRIFKDYFYWQQTRFILHIMFDGSKISFTIKGDEMQA
jgi:hypothetical protein